MSLSSVETVYSSRAAETETAHSQLNPEMVIFGTYVGFISQIEEYGASWLIFCGVSMSTVAHVVPQLKSILIIGANTLHHNFHSSD